MINSSEHGITTANKKRKYRQMKKCLALSLSDVVFTCIMLIYVKVPTNVGNCCHFNINEQDKFRAHLS